MIAESPSPETPATASQPSAAPPPPSAPEPQRLPAYRWVLEGLRAAAFLTPRTGIAAPTPLQLLVLLAANWGLVLWGEWWATAGPVEFNARAWLGQQWLSLALMGAAWWAMAPAQDRSGVFTNPQRAPGGGLPAWLLLSNWAMLPWLLPTFALPASVDASLAADPLAGAGD